MSSHLWAECARIACDGGLAAVATVVRRRGSLPMSATAKMLVTAGGARIGTVGGGCLEAEIVERAQDVIQSRVPLLSRHTLNASLAGDYGLTCGGTATLFIEPVFGDETLVQVYVTATDLLANGESAVVVTDSTWDAAPAKAVATSDRVIGRVPGKLASRAAELLARELPLLSRGVAYEPLVAAPPLIVFGGGHVGGAIARAASLAGWTVTIVDDRPDFASVERHPSAAATVCCDFHDVASALRLTPRTFAVVATRGHQHDALIVDQLARLDLRYIGMLGSRRKVALTWKLLESWGVERERLARVHAPVGLPIGADTPEEIAVSVVAEMIRVRRMSRVRRGGQSALFSATARSPQSVRTSQPAV